MMVKKGNNPHGLNSRWQITNDNLPMDSYGENTGKLMENHRDDGQPWGMMENDGQSWGNRLIAGAIDLPMKYLGVQSQFSFKPIHQWLDISKYLQRWIHTPKISGCPFPNISKLQFSEKMESTHLQSYWVDGAPWGNHIGNSGHGPQRWAIGWPAETSRTSLR